MQNKELRLSLSPPTENAAFSLVEVVVALGIVSFAIVAVMGMLPIALKTSRESMTETDATMIARRIFSEISCGTNSQRSLSTDTNNGVKAINLATDSSNTFIAFRETGEALYATNTNSTVNSINTDYLAQISISTNTGISNLSRVLVDILSPAAASPTNRATNSFVTLVGY